MQKFLKLSGAIQYQANPRKNIELRLKQLWNPTTMIVTEETSKTSAKKLVRVVPVNLKLKGFLVCLFLNCFQKSFLNQKPLN